MKDGSMGAKCKQHFFKSFFFLELKHITMFHLPYISDVRCVSLCKSTESNKITTFPLWENKSLCCWCGCYLLLFHNFSVSFDAFSPLRDKAVSWHQSLHHFPLLLFLNQVLRDTPPSTFPSGQVLTGADTYRSDATLLSCLQKHTFLSKRCWWKKEP